MPQIGEIADPDLRMPLLGLAAWAGALVAHSFTGPWLLGGAAAAALAGGVLVRRRGRAALATVAAVLLVGGAVAGVTWLRAESLHRSPVADLAQERAVVSVSGRVVSDPRTIEGRFERQVVVRLGVHRITGRGSERSLRAPVLVIGGGAWLDVPLGADVTTSGRLAPADDDDLAGVLVAARDPDLVAEPDIWWRAAGAVRRSIRDSVAGRPIEQRALVPALVDGDDAELPEELERDFQTTGLTHLTAVSGTNLTLVVGFVLVLARWCGVRRRWLYVVGAAGIAGFVLIARTEPSVLRAAVMGAVGLLAMGANGRHRALRGLGVAVVLLLLVQPGLAVSVGFALSVLATAGIVILAPGWRDALMRWLPRWLAEAIAVPAAAQLACTPVVAAISGQVSLVAVAANLVVAPVVGPATVLGLAGGLVGLVVPPLGRLLGGGAGWCVAWIATVAERGADLPAAAVGWGTGVLALVALTALSVLVAIAAPAVLRRPVVALTVMAMLAGFVLVRWPSPGWPASGWVLAMCDVGQGDALVLNAGPGSGVVVDVGPEPGLVDDCLRRLGIDEVPLLVLTHFHADHVDGLAGVVDGRRVGAVLTTRVLDPPSGAEEVAALARAHGLAAGPASYAATATYGAVTLQVLWPLPGPLEEGSGDGSAANDASVVVLAEVGGLRILLTGDVEPPGQAALARTLPGLDIDVLKVPHHGSRYQDLPWLDSLRAEVALVSVGADNDYGHPAAPVIDALTESGAEIFRTDLSGDVLVLPDGDDAAVRTRGPN
ncbi:MAG TPA: ComEC/Rec2 family competence protein [Pseudonocardia sp.]|nr:ComEC/Rec2 family competence protein [Pseudonocardia sp.]